MSCPPSEHVAGPNQESPGSDALPLKRILICDDHDLMRRGVKQFLTEHLGRVHFGEAKNGEEALGLFRKEKWDLVLLDITMPGKDGLALLPEFKAIHPKVPVLVFSGLLEEEYAIRSLKAGAAGFISKGDIASQLSNAIEVVMDGHRYISPAVAEQMAASVLDSLGASPHQSLSEREFQVMRLLAGGKAVKEIAADLCLSSKTVSTYRARVCAKLSVQSDAEIARYALKNGLVD